MEYRHVVYNACRDGKITRLKTFLDRRSKDEVFSLVHAKTNGATPLIMASRNGHIDVVRYLIEFCKADKAQQGSVRFDGETIEGAPPLWCAAAAGHLDIVRYLVDTGADVNQTTYTNSTPLRAACFDGHFEIVKFLILHNADIEIANRHGHTCLMIACYKGHKAIAEYLLDLKAQVNRKSVKGNTALHDCAESGSLEIMKLLLERGATMDRDSYSMTPLMAAAVAGFHNVVSYIIQLPECARVERVEALELLGATYVDKKRDNMAAISVWRQAIEERNHPHKQRLEKPNRADPVAAYENAVEVQTVDELEELIVDPDEMRMQALLVRERVLGRAHPDTSYYIRYRGALYADMGNFERCITLWQYALDMQQAVLEPLSAMTLSSFLSFAELFSFMLTEWRHRVERPVSGADILEVLRRGVNEVRRSCSLPDVDVTNMNRLLVIMLHLLSLMTSMDSVKKSSPNNFAQVFKCLAYELVHLNARGSNRSTLLHMACMRDTTNVGRYPVCTFPSLDVVNLLLEVGADSNVRDQQGNTPLHVASKFRSNGFGILLSLLGHGAHLDTCNNERTTPLDNLKGVAYHDAFSPLSHVTLQCLAARVISQHGNIPYKGCVSPKIEDFIQMH